MNWYDNLFKINYKKIAYLNIEIMDSLYNILSEIWILLKMDKIIKLYLEYNIYN